MSSNPTVEELKNFTDSLPKDNEEVVQSPKKKRERKEIVFTDEEVKKLKLKKEEVSRLSYDEKKVCVIKLKLLKQKETIVEKEDKILLIVGKKFVELLKTKDKVSKDDVFNLLNDKQKEKFNTIIKL